MEGTDRLAKPKIADEDRNHRREIEENREPRRRETCQGEAGEHSRQE